MGPRYDNVATQHDSGKAHRIVYVVQQFPTLRTTFIRREVEALRKLGLDLRVYSMRPPPKQELAGEREAEEHLQRTHYLPANPLHTGCIWANAISALRRPWQTLRNVGLLFADAGGRGLMPRVRLALQVWRGAILANAIRKSGGCTRVHAHFADGAATTALAAARLLRVPFSFTSHTSHESPALRQKLREADFVASISEYDRQRLLKLDPAAPPQRIHVIHCGIPLDEWPFDPKEKWNDPPVLLSVGALIETKGHDVLIDACKLLRDRGIDFRCRIVGAGPLRESLQAQIERLGLRDRVVPLGSLPQQLVHQELRDCDGFVLACKRAANGDTDGIPVSLMEAMAIGRPVVAGRIAGVPELVIDGVTGWLAEPGDASSLADRLSRVLLDCPHGELPRAARQHVEGHFESSSEAKRLAELFGVGGRLPADGVNHAKAVATC